MRNRLIRLAGDKPKLKAALFAGAACVVASGAIAQVEAPTTPLRLQTDYFGYAAAVSPRVGYSDNINLAPDGLENDELVFSTLFSAAAVYSRKSLTGVISGDLDFSYLTDAGDFAVNQNIGAAGTLTVADNLFYIDVAGSTTRQLLGDNARFSSNINAARSQRANVHTISASPYFYREFADRSSAQLRYRFSQVFIDDERSGANPFSDNFLNDSRSHEVMASYQTGTQFDRLVLAFTAYGNETVEDGSVIFPRYQFRQGTVMGEAQYALTSSFALTGAVGYDEIETEITPPIFNDANLSGVFWRAGFQARPGRKSSLRLEYGSRFGDEFVTGNASYRISDRLLFTAGAGQHFQSRAQSVSAQFIDQQRSLLAFADQLRQGGEVSPEGVIAMANRYSNTGVYAQASGVGVSKNAYARLQGAFERTEITGAITYQDTDFGFREIETISGNLDIRRELSRRFSAYGGVFYRQAETTIDQTSCQANPFLFGFDVTDPLFDPVAACLDYAAANGETTTVGGRIGVAYRLYKNLSAFGEYSRTNRFADSALLEYKENAVVAGVTLDF